MSTLSMAYYLERRTATEFVSLDLVRPRKEGGFGSTWFSRESDMI